jgi:hypothetical protein
MGVPGPDIAQAKGFFAPPAYSRHRPETTLLYRLVAEHLTPVTGADGEIADVEISYPQDLTRQMLEYSGRAGN